MTSESDQHRDAMQSVQDEMRDKVKAANKKQGVLIYLFGQGKGKSSSAFGTLMRAVGHGQRAAVIQFIKGSWKTGEERYFAEQPLITHDVMGSGFTWDSQDKEKDKRLAKEAWMVAKEKLQDETVQLVVIDELTYMFDFEYLDLQDCVDALRNRPTNQNVILTGRSRIDALYDLADTVSEVVEHKHAFNDGVRAQAGIEF